MVLLECGLFIYCFPAHIWCVHQRTSGTNKVAEPAKKPHKKQTKVSETATTMEENFSGLVAKTKDWLIVQMLK